jgi:hypothetical protein
LEKRLIGLKYISIAQHGMMPEPQSPDHQSPEQLVERDTRRILRLNLLIDNLQGWRPKQGDNECSIGF